jgi:parallel beta-helix repeat protein
MSSERRVNGRVGHTFRKYVRRWVELSTACNIATAVVLGGGIAGCVDTPTGPTEPRLSPSAGGAYSESVLGTSLTLPAEGVEPPVDLHAILVYETLLPGLGELLSDPLAVTDAELAGVGSSDAVVSLQMGTPISFVVDDDRVQCPDADFTTSTGIQQAITAAPPGARIRVCAGVYAPIIVNKPLIIEHPVQHGQATQCQAALVPDPTKDAVIDAGNSAVIAVTLAANDIVLYGFHVQHTNGNPGIYSLPTFSGYQILFNVIQENTFGLYFNASGTTQSTAEHNCIRFNNRPGSSSGDGIYSDQGLRNAVIDNNFFTGHQSAAIVMAQNQQDIQIVHNDVVNDQGTIVLVTTQNALVAHNHQILPGTSSGIFVGGGVTGTRIAYNLVEHPSTGVSANTAFSPVANEVVVEKNHIRDATFDGIRFDNTSNSSIIGNKAQLNQRDGIRLRNNSNMNTVQDNLSRDNGRDGIRVDGLIPGTPPMPQSSLNTIERNTALGNFEHDCHDDSVGPGTAGTANTWIRNIGKTENRPGLCKKKL